MHRLLVETRQLDESELMLTGEAAKHLKVLRPENDEQIELFDGNGSWRVYRYRAATRDLSSDGTQQSEEERPEELTLFACITKGSRWDWTIEKATELGVTRIVPVISARTIVRLASSERAAKRERWQRIAEEAARQSDSRWLPEVVEPVDFGQAIQLASQTRCLIGALTNPPSPPIGKALGNAVFIGPEGDFTSDELEALKKVASPVSFGRQVLRAETAAIFALSAILAKRNSGLA